MYHLVSAKTALQRAIDHMERLYQGRNAGGVVSLAEFPHAELAFRTALSMAVGHQRRTCVLSETFPPDQAALHMLCAKGRIPITKVAARQLEEADFTRLTGAAAKISAAPLYFSTAEPFDIEQIAWDILPLMKAHDFQVLVCEKRTDDDLESWQAELDFLARMHGLDVRLLTGRPAPVSRLTPDFGQMA